MDSKEFSSLRKKLNKTQLQMAYLLGTSLKAVHSYEQGWRRIPTHVERQILFLAYRKSKATKNHQPCWKMKNCPSERRKNCPAWEYDSGDLCWFISGTICEGSAHETWEDKMKICRTCKVFASRF